MLLLNLLQILILSSGLCVNYGFISQYSFSFNTRRVNYERFTGINKCVNSKEANPSVRKLNNRPAVIANIPNILTISRIVMIPLFGSSFISKKKTSALLIYILSCVTDILDGVLARKLNQTSNFGAFLDPVADKLMVSTALVLIVCQLPSWWIAVPVSIILGREIGVSALREWMAEKGSRAIVKVGWIGKCKTAMQMISTILLQLCTTEMITISFGKSIQLSKPMFFSVGILALYVATLLTLISGIQYLLAAWPYLTQEGNESPST